MTIQISIVMLYRLTLHPLANYPGPVLAKITGWYDTYHCLRKDKAQDQFRCQQEYGPVFRYGPNFLVVNTVEGLRDIYPATKNTNVRKGPQYAFLHHNGSVSTLSAIDKDVHQIKRKNLARCFTEQALRSLEHLMIKTIDNWIEALGADATAETMGWSSPKDMADWANYLTFDVLGDLCFGAPFGLINSPKYHAAPNLMLARTRFLAVVST
jgi:cytochrome P450